jgi:YHS domain-containing protein
MPDRPSLRTPTSFPPRCRAVAALTLALLPALAQADVEWHADLDTARAASRISRRPVLAVFVASWSAEATALEATSLGSPEAEAVLATCFEPVRIDIDDRPDLTRTAGITHVPTACVLLDDGAPLVSFEMPASATEFVTTAILTAQRVAVREEGASNADDAGAATPATGAGAELPVTAAAFGSTTDPATITARPPRGSMARVAAKVRDLSTFARSQSQPAPRAQPTAIAHATRNVSDTAIYPAPVSWPAMPSTAPPTGLAPPPPLDPAPTALTPTAVAPWLDAPPAPRPAPASLAAAATPAPSTAPLPPTVPSPAPPAARQSGLIAALQKPFGLGPKPEPPATMPPALPRGPFAAATEPPVPPQATTPAATGGEEDRYGSMPLGLEGYCPVTLVDRGSWQEGRAQWGARHRGRTYLFAGPDEQRTFLSNPDRYAPALSGDDPVLALDRGTVTPGQRRYGVTYQARMYLFATPETRQAFTADPGRYVARIAIAERTPAPNSATRLY